MSGLPPPAVVRQCGQFTLCFIQGSGRFKVAKLFMAAAGQGYFQVLLPIFFFLQGLANYIIRCALSTFHSFSFNVAMLLMKGKSLYVFNGQSFELANV